MDPEILPKEKDFAQISRQECRTIEDTSPWSQWSDYPHHGLWVARCRVANCIQPLPIDTGTYRPARRRCEHRASNDNERGVLVVVDAVDLLQLLTVLLFFRVCLFLVRQSRLACFRVSVSSVQIFQSFVYKHVRVQSGSRVSRGMAGMARA